MSEKKNKNFWSYSNEILSLAMPLIVSQIAILGIGVTDIYMAGQLDAETLAAVQLSISIWNMISLTVIGFMVANSPIIGEFWGSSKYSSVKNQFQQCLWLSIPISVLIIIALSIGIYSLKNLSISAKVAEIATGYLLPYFITAFVLPVFLVFRTTFEGMGNTKPILIFNCIAFAINALLDYMLVFGKFGAPNMGGIGAAWATTFAYSFLLIAMIFYAKLSRGNKLLNLFSNFQKPKFDQIKRTLNLGIPISLNLLAEFGFFAIIPILIAHLGANIVAAHAITINIDALAFMIPLGIAQALTILVSQRLGSLDARDARVICITGFKLVFVFALTLSFLKILFRFKFAELFSNDEQVQLIAVNLFIFSAVLGLFDCFQMTCSGALRGYKEAKIPLVIQIFAFWIIVFPIAYVISLTNWIIEPLGVYGFWIGCILAVILAGIGLLIRWNAVSKKAIRNLVIQNSSKPIVTRS